MQIQNVNVQEENERAFTDYLSRQTITNLKQFIFDVDGYRAQYPQAAQQLIKDPSKYYVLIKKYLQKNANQNEHRRKADQKIDHFDIKIDGNLGANFVTPRGLNSRMANQLVGLQGIITKMDLYKNYLEKSVHYCPKTKATETRQYPDSFNPEKDGDLNRARTIKTYDQNNNPLQFEYGMSSFKDTQMVVIQELPEMAPPGLLPMSVQVVLQNNLVNAVKPGDRVQMIGIYKLVAGMNTKQKGIFRPYFLCLSVKPLSQTASMNRKPANMDFQKDTIFDLFSRSIAPAIWGHTMLKKAVLLMLVGGVQKVLQNNTHLRGDINLLMVGDPGTAKSQMLRWVLSTVDVSVGTTGSGASGVGLTAAIVSDKQTGQRTLEAGAMVLADRGVVCIDQFDKMNQTDRVAVHEVMEQQTVTIAKAGMHCSLNARCSVIAAANPIYGQYQTSMPPTKNIGMADSLLSRFDLVFIILDQKNSIKDKQIAEKVCRNHRLAPLSNDFMNQYMDADQFVVNPIEDKIYDDSTYEKNNVYKGQGKVQVLTQNYLKSYIRWVKQNIVPALSDQVVELSAELWNLLRQKDFNQKEQCNTKVLPITIRTYESLIRLSTAHAKLLQLQTVQVNDVLQGFKLIVYCLFSDQNALDADVRVILKQLGIDQPYQPSQDFNKKTFVNIKLQPKEESKKMENEEEEVKHKMGKLDLRRGQRQADQALQKQLGQEQSFTKEQLAMVYKKISDLTRRKKGNQKWIKQDQLFQTLKKQIKTGDKLKLILDDLQQKNKISVEEDRIFSI